MGTVADFQAYVQTLGGFSPFKYPGKVLIVSYDDL